MAIHPEVADLRRDYTLEALVEADANPDPFAQFQQWFDASVKAELPEPNAMTLATIDAAGSPAARIVLLKDFDNRGFVLFTNYSSHKGQELSQTPKAALVFLWAELERQVRIQGTVEKISPEESDSYFYSRPHSSRLGAWASNQSEVIPNREVLDRQLEALKAEYEGKEVPRPPHWGGFRVKPQTIEFWQGRTSRLHDRLRYRLTEGVWAIDRLSP
jgi:pyridoxamine 5'-phosphate oxidase